MESGGEPCRESANSRSQLCLSLFHALHFAADAVDFADPLLFELVQRVVDDIVPLFTGLLIKSSAPNSIPCMRSS